MRSKALLPGLVLGATFASLAAWIGRGLLPDPTLDDAWIYLSAARTLQETGRLAASPHHQVLVGITCPAYPVLLAGLGSVIDLPKAAAGIGLLAGTLAPWFAFSFLLQAQSKPRSPWIALVAAMPLALSGALSANAITGMESILYALGITVAASVHARRGVGWRSGLVAAALSALRTDGALVAAAISGESLISLCRSDRRSRWARLRRLAQFLLPVVIASTGLAACFLLTTGKPVANTPSARIALYGWGEGSHLSRLWRGAIGAASIARANPWWAALWLLGVVTCWSGSRRFGSADSTGRWLTLLSCAYAIVVGLAGAPLNYQFSRYFLPAITAGSIVAGLGFTRGWFTARAPWKQAMFGVLLLGSFAEASQILSFRVATDLLVGMRPVYDAQLRAVSRLLDDGERIAVVDAGWPLWILRRPVLDLGGLVDSQATAVSMEPGGRVIPFRDRDVTGYLSRERVRWLVINEPLWSPLLPVREGPASKRLPFDGPYSVYGVTPDQVEARRSGAGGRSTREERGPAFRE